MNLGCCGYHNTLVTDTMRNGNLKAHAPAFPPQLWILVLTYSSIPAHWPFMLSSSACSAAIQQLWGSSSLFMSPKSTLTAAPSLPPMALMPLDQIFLHPWPFCALMSLFQDEKKPKVFSLNRIKYHKSFLKISSQWKRVSFLIRKDMSVPHGV